MAHAGHHALLAGSHQMLVLQSLHEGLLAVDESQETVSVSLVVSLNGLLLSALRHALEALQSERARFEAVRGSASARRETAGALEAAAAQGVDAAVEIGGRRGPRCAPSTGQRRRETAR